MVENWKGVTCININIIEKWSKNGKELVVLILI